MSQDIRESSLEYTPELKVELDSRYSDYKSSKTKMISSAESKIRIGRILKTGKAK